MSAARSSHSKQSTQGSDDSCRRGKVEHQVRHEACFVASKTKERQKRPGITNDVWRPKLVLENPYSEMTSRSTMSIFRFAILGGYKFLATLLVSFPRTQSLAQITKRCRGAAWFYACYSASFKKLTSRSCMIC